MKRLLKIIAVSLIAVVLLLIITVGGLHLFLKTPPGERLFFTVLNSFIPGEITSEKSSISLLGQSAELTDGELKGPDRQVILHVEKLRLTIDFAALLRYRVVFPSISILNPRLMLIRYADGTLNIVKAVVEEKPEEEGPEFEVSLPRFAAENGFISYDDEGLNIHSRMQGVLIRGGMDFSRPEGSIYTTITDARLDLAGSRIDLKQTGLAASLAGENLSPLNFQTYLGQYELDLKGSIRDLFTRPDFNVTLDSGGPLSDLAALADLDERFTGRMESRISIRGTLDNPDASADIRYSGGQLAGVRVARGNAALSLKDRMVTVREIAALFASGRAAAKGTINLQEAFPKGFLKGEPSLAKIVYDLSGTASNLSPAVFLAGKSTYPDTVSGRVSLSGKGVVPPHVSARASYNLAMSGSIDGSPVRVGNVGLDGQAWLDYPVLKIASTGTVDRATSAAARGTVDLDSKAILAHVNLDVRNISEVLTGSSKQAAGSVTASADITGSIDHPRIATHAQARGLRWKEYFIGAADLDAVLRQDGTVEVANLDLNNGEPFLKARGSLGVFGKDFAIRSDLPLSLDASLRSEDLKRLIAREGVTGNLEGQAHIGGSLFNPAGTVSLKGTDIDLGKVTLGDIDMQGSISDGIVRVGSLELRNGDSALQSSGSIHILDTKKKRVVEDPDIDLTIAGDTLMLEDFVDDFFGTASVHARVSGSVGNPHGTALVKGENLNIKGQKVGEVLASALMADHRVSFENLSVTVKQGQAISGRGWISTAGRNDYDFHIFTSGDGIDLNAFPALKDYEVTGGLVTIDLAGQGSLDNPRLSGTAGLTKLTVNYQRLGDASVELDMDDGKVSLAGKDGFDFQGTYDIWSSDLVLDTHFENTELGPYFSIAGRPDLGGVIDGSVAARGNLRHMDKMSASIDIKKVAVLLDDNLLLSASNLKAGYRDRKLTVPKSTISLMNQGTMEVQAVTDISGMLNLTAQGNAPLSIAAAFDPDLSELQGTMRFDLSAEGPIKKPRVNGDIYLNNVEYVLSYNDQFIHALNGHLQLTNDRIFVKELTGMLDTGSFDAQGSIGLKDFEPADIDLVASARSLPFVMPDSLNLLLDAKATLTGTPDDTLLEGNAVILEGQYYKDVQLNIIAEVGERITSERRVARAQSEPIDLPFLRNMSLDVFVSSRGPVGIENNLADATISPDLEVIGTLNDPIVTGRVSVVSGTVTYQKRSFDITKGVINFSNPYRTEADVDIKAEGKIRDWTIGLAVTGPLDNLNIELSSTPAADNATILSLLATGKTPDELIGKTGGTSKSPSSMLADVLAGTYGQKVKKTAGVDILEIETGTATTAAGQAGESIKITVGEELTRRLTLKYSMENTNNELIRTTTAEYKLLENILVNGFQDSKGGFGADLQFSVEFR